MSEEIRDAPVVVPRSIVWSVVLNGAIGLSMFIAILFCIGDINAAVTSTYVYPFIEVLIQATKSVAGTAVILAIIIIVDLALVIGVVAASSRMLWSFARDRGVPGWRQISKVSRKSCGHLLSLTQRRSINIARSPFQPSSRLSSPLS